MDNSLNVISSVGNSKWEFPTIDEDLVSEAIRIHNIPDIVARLLQARNIPIEETQSFLYQTLSKDFPDPFSLKDMEGAAEFIADAVEACKKIALFGDFDVDGATSTSLLRRFFHFLKIQTRIYIPDRLKEGYGPNVGALKALHDEGYDIVLMSDCGTSANDIIADGRDMGLDIIILDHHEQADILAPANFIINPKRNDDCSGLEMLAAVGVSFLFAVAVNAKLRSRGWYNNKDITEPAMKSLMDIVALGTICDMVPMKGANRLFVRHGLKKMENMENVGLKALCSIAGLKSSPTVRDCGFALGPRINAGGRVGQCDLGARLLSCDNDEEAIGLAFALDECNRTRRKIEADMLVQAMAQVEETVDDSKQKHAIFAYNPDWHHGLVGLVAGRLKERYKRPAFVISIEEGQGRGSARSIKGVNIAKSLMDAKDAGLLIKGGGHAMAGGFAIEPDKISAFQEFINIHIKNQIEQQAKQVQIISLDGIFVLGGKGMGELANILHEHLGPFGMEHEEPIFAIPSAMIDKVDIIGSNHVRAFISDRFSGGRMKAMAFRAAGTAIGKAIIEGQGSEMHLAGHIRTNEWQGRKSIEMHILDVAYAGVTALDKKYSKSA